MSFQNYSSQFKSQCLEIFDSNVGKFFDLSERVEYSEYLDSIGNESCYYVYVSNGEVRACGGYGIHNKTASLTWGMVHRNYHAQRLGSMLTDFRLSLIDDLDKIELVKIQTSQYTSGFYAKRGFKELSKIMNGFGDGIDCIEMELVINH